MIQKRLEFQYGRDQYKLKQQKRIVKSAFNRLEAIEEKYGMKNFLEVNICAVSPKKDA